MSAAVSETDTPELDARLQAFEGVEVGPATPGPDPVNQAMVRHWVQAMGDELPIYTDAEAAAASVHGELVAPPVMLQAWVMRGLDAHGGRHAEGGEPSPQDELMNLLDEAGYTSVVATNCEQDYHRYPKLGDHLHMSTVIESVSGEKQTGLGIGRFVTTRADYADEHGEPVGSMRFRILKFKPGTGRSAKKEPSGAAAGEGEKPRPTRPRPSLNHDNRFWFEAAAEHRLVIQRCASCGELRHPPGPACPHCGSFEWDTVESAGRGTVYSFVITHHPQVPAFDYPLPIGLIELDEGIRLVSNVIDVEPDEVHIGMRVEVTFVDVDDELTLPQFRPAARAAAESDK